MSHAIVGPLVLASVLTASVATAQTRTGESLDPAIERRISGEIAGGAWHPILGGYTLFGSLAAFASGRVGVWSRDERGLGTIELEGTLRGYFGRTYEHVGTFLCCAIGGSTMSLMFGWSDGASIRLRGGPAVVLPFAMLNGDSRRAERMTHFGHAIVGLWDRWDGFVHGPGMLARGDVDARAGALLAGGDLAVGASLWLLDANEETPVAVAFYQVGAYVGAQATDWLAIGARVQLAGWSDGGGTPNVVSRPADAQLSLVPFVRFLVRPGFVEVRGTLNLDEPEGLATRSKVWGVRIAGGVELGP
ncbi:hypothetical protein [Sandaracinus amylolyticus]|uniref:Transporter n=1 Tax=Sandaracinus amylolyticus TaxID=927083 RepID=A0A0F6W853_9BACT|nr:hypothetical protein [Sandaracinus amylolyticus]AKF09918.1 hypothetical protein DB32_007067 [Sandaracinus amylolyticus]